MKKFLAIVFTILFVNNIASATTIVTFNNTGVRKTIQHGCSNPRNAYTPGRNAAFLPRNRVLAGQRQRAIARQDAITRAIANFGSNNSYNHYGSYYNNRSTNTVASSAPTQVSRLNKNYTVKTQKSYTRNGITYYN